MSTQLPSRRISLEVPVTEKDRLHRWVSGRVGSDVKLKVPDDYHLTVLYLGKVDEVFDAVRSVPSARRNPLPAQEFMNLLASWLRVHSLALRHSSVLTIDTLITLGTRPPLAAVCKVSQLPAELTDLHSQLLVAFEQFLEQDLGVHSGSGLLRSSEAFGFSGKSWVPHITIGTSASIAEIPLPVFEVEVGPLQVRNGSSLGVYG